MSLPASVDAVEPDVATAPAPVPQAGQVDEERCSTPDLCMRRILGLPTGAPTATETSASVSSTSMRSSP